MFEYGSPFLDRGPAPPKTNMLEVGELDSEKLNLYFCNRSGRSQEEALAITEKISNHFAQYKIMGHYQHPEYKLSPAKVTLLFNSNNSTIEMEELSSRNILKQAAFANGLASQIKYYAQEQMSCMCYVPARVAVLIAEGDGAKIVYQALTRLEDKHRELVIVYTFNAILKIPSIFARTAINYIQDSSSEQSSEEVILIPAKKFKEVLVALRTDLETQKLISELAV